MGHEKTHAQKAGKALARVIYANRITLFRRTTADKTGVRLRPGLDTQAITNTQIIGVLRTVGPQKTGKKRHTNYQRQKDKVFFHFTALQKCDFRKTLHFPKTENLFLLITFIRKQIQVSTQNVKIVQKFWDKDMSCSCFPGSHIINESEEKRKLELSLVSLVRLSARGVY